MSCQKLPSAVSSKCSQTSLLFIGKQGRVTCTFKFPGEQSKGEPEEATRREARRDGNPNLGILVSTPVLEGGGVSALADQNSPQDVPHCPDSVMEHNMDSQQRSYLTTNALDRYFFAAVHRAYRSQLPI